MKYVRDSVDTSVKEV